MEQNTPTPGGGVGAEAGPSPSNIETPNEAATPNVVEAAPAVFEVDRTGVETVNQNQGMVLPVPAQPQPVAQPVTQPQDDQGDDSNPPAIPIDAPDLADDVDVIEKEWVDKAKEIVGQTKEDPRKQNHNVSLLKADYMKKRYGKDIKIPDDKPVET